MEGVYLIAGAVAALLLLAGCSRTIHQWTDDEVSPSTYASLARQLAYEPPASPRRAMLHRFIADNKITYGELREWNDFNQREADSASDVAAAKAAMRGGQ